jgi:ABC-2 type transport system permease protein
VDRLIALVVLRFRLDLRALLGARERLFGLVLLVPMLALGSAAASFFVFVGIRAVARTHPEWLLSVVSVVATVVGLLWAFSPVLAGISFSDTHDMSRLLHFPVPLPVLVVSSLLANLLEPLVLAKLPPLIALALALGGLSVLFPFSLVGVLLAFAFTLAASQVTGLFLLGLSRNRRWQDRALFVGLGVGFALSLLPLLLTTVGGRALRLVVGFVLDRDLFLLSPFGWGLRAAAHAGRGEIVPFLGFAAASAAATVAVMGAAAVLTRRIYRGELDLSSSRGVGPAAGARMIFSGPLGTLLEKDLRVMWRDPRLKALLFTGVLGPVLLFLFVSQGGRRVTPLALFMLAVFLGLGTFGANAMALERRGLLLLVAFPFPRWEMLVAKNLGAMLLRLPGVLLLGLVSLFLVAPALVPAVMTTAAVTLLLCSAADNFVSVLFPIPVPAAGRTPYAGGGRGLGAAVLATVLLLGVLVLAAPFVFLSALPWLLDEPWLSVVALPLALAGALSFYAMLVAGAARLFSRREPEFLEKALVEE